MNTNKILQSDVLDIIFDDRNKAYGAYELRKNYHKRLKKALMISTTFILVAVSAPLVASLFDKPIIIDRPMKEDYKITEVIIKDDLPKVQEIKVKEEIPPATDVNTIKNTPPTIVETIEVKPDDKMPTQEDLKEATSGIATHEGETKPSGEILTQGNGHGTEVIIPIENKPNEEEKTFDMEDLSQMPEYPGGEDELMKYLASNIIYPKRAIEDDKQGRVVLGFVVNKEGNIEDINVVKGIGYGCDEEAIRVVNKMPKWKPGKNNGRPVKVYYNLPITFELN